jgi:hypothetical protein
LVLSAGRPFTRGAADTDGHTNTTDGISVVYQP